MSTKDFPQDSSQDPSQVMGLSNFTRWVKGTILRRSPTSNDDDANHHDIHDDDVHDVAGQGTRPTSFRRGPSRSRVSSPTKRSVTTTTNKGFSPRSLPIDDDDRWMDQGEDDILHKDEMIIPDLNPTLTDMYEIPQGRDHHDFLENTHIIRGSVEHFAYVRTVRKLRIGKDRQRCAHQTLFLNKILANLSSQISENVYKELIHYKFRVFELNKIQRNGDPSSSPRRSNSTLSLMSKRFSATLSEVRQKSFITMQYRPSYASSKVLTVFDDEMDRLVVKDLPMARKRKRLISLSNTLVRSTSSSSTSSANSSQSSLTTLTDQAEQQKYLMTTKDPDTYLPDIMTSQDDEEDGDEEDDVPLFVLKEQFRYSGRGYAPSGNNLTLVERNGLSRVTVAV